MLFRSGKDKLTRQMVEELFTIREMAEDMEDDGDVDYEVKMQSRRMIFILKCPGAVSDSFLKGSLFYYFPPSIRS